MFFKPTQVNRLLQVKYWDLCPWWKSKPFIQTGKPKIFSCTFSTSPLKFNQRQRYQNNKSVGIRTTLLYVAAGTVVMIGATYWAVPLYRIFCQAYSYGGTTATHDSSGKSLGDLEKKKKLIRIIFNADKASSMRWNFHPEQSSIDVYPGETALAFYRAENQTGVAIDGVSTYNVVPFDAGRYFNKIQCFCFEEQRLNAGEKVELPVFFYIDPDFTEDPDMEKVDEIVLSYTFFESKEMPNVKIPWGMHGKIGSKKAD